MTACVRVLIGLAMWNMLVGAALADPPPYVNEVGKMWEVRYDKKGDNDPPNKNKDLAIRVHIYQDPDNAGKYLLELFRFDEVYGGTSYMLKVPNGRIPGIPLTHLKSGKKRQSFTATKKLNEGSKQEETVTIKGWWHTGPGRVEPGGIVFPRADERLHIRIIGPRHDVTKAAQADTVHDCEEEPDTDVLAELPVALIDPMVPNVYVPPTYP